MGRTSGLATPEKLWGDSFGGSLPFSPLLPFLKKGIVKSKNQPHNSASLNAPDAIRLARKRRKWPEIFPSV
jgi:hypothetical protein